MTVGDLLEATNILLGHNSIANSIASDVSFFSEVGDIPEMVLAVGPLSPGPTELEEELFSVSNVSICVHGGIPPTQYYITLNLQTPQFSPSSTQLHPTHSPQSSSSVTSQANSDNESVYEPDKDESTPSDEEESSHSAVDTSNSPSGIEVTVQRKRAPFKRKSRPRKIGRRKTPTQHMCKHCRKRFGPLQATHNSEAKGIAHTYLSR